MLSDAVHGNKAVEAGVRRPVRVDGEFQRSEVDWVGDAEGGWTNAVCGWWERSAILSLWEERVG